ncbi:MAG: ATP-binding cassette domain-containing protein, partial [Gemmatimonadetes bacterium]|nr:ATP-binding cassette domain-containing protein [Gemmatimonadota bacterium]
MSGNAVELRGVTKRYAGHTAVRNLSLEIPRGAIYGLLGPNGAGKTTTIRAVIGIVRPDEGTVTVLGNPEGGWAVSERIGYLPEERGLYRKMRVLELLVFLAEAKGVKRSLARAGAVQWLERLGLSAWQTRKVDELSKGMQQKVQFIATLLH